MQQGIQLALFFALIHLITTGSCSCAVPAVGIGFCDTNCSAPLQAFSGYCPGSDAVCCVYPNDPAKHQSEFYQNWCQTNGQSPDHCTYLDDIYCQKTFPSAPFTDSSRDFQCMNQFDSGHLDGFTPFSRPVSRISVDTSALVGVVADDFFVSVIVIRRDLHGIPFYKYLSNGNERQVFQPWSSSKPFAAANAASNLRVQSEGHVGFASVEQNTKRPLGDLSTIVHSYDSTHNLSSNCLAGYFHDIGGHQRLNDTLHTWLGVSSAESLGGPYGCNDTYGMGGDFDSLENGEHAHVDLDGFCCLPNQLSALSASEFYRRLIMTREDSSNTYPGLEWSDVREIMYGPADSTLFPGLHWGGATTDTSWYLQSGLNMSQVDADSQGQWRILSKLGAGCAERTPACEIVYNSYACLPNLQSPSAPSSSSSSTPYPVLNGGHEMVISARYNGQTICDADQRMQTNVAAAVQYVLTHF